MFTPELRIKAEQLCERYPERRSALLPLLHLVQYQNGWITRDSITECAELVGMTAAEVEAVATFYTMYKHDGPMGDHLVSVCTNFACAVRGGKAVYQALQDHLKVGHEGTTEDGKITLEHAECLGNCEGAPVVTVDYMNYERLTPEEAINLVENLRKGVVPPPTRGMIPPGVRNISHRLAGIGPVDEHAPGQKLGLDTAKDGAVVRPAAGPDALGVAMIDLDAGAEKEAERA